MSGRALTAKSTPTNYSASVINPVSSDTDACFIITFDQARYVFNCSENTTRTFVQRQIGFSKIKAVFFTGINSDRSGGLPGFLMSLADSGTRELDVVGPSGTAHFIASTRPYTYREVLRMRLVECQPKSNSALPIFSDDHLTVYAIPVLPLSPSKLLSNPQHATSSPPTSPPDSSPPSKRKRSISPPVSPSKRTATGDVTPRLNSQEPSSLQGQAAANYRASVVRTMFPGTSVPTKASGATPPMNKRLPPFQSLPLHLSYICVFPEMRGKFDTQKAAAFGVFGANRGKLTRGISVTGKDGTTITPEMCIGSSNPPTALFVVDCPTIEYIEALCSSQRFNSYKMGTGSTKVLCIFHRLGEGVLQNITYKEWMQSFGPDIHHIIADDTLSPDKATFYSSAEALLRLNRLDPDIFHIPHTILSAPSTLDLTGLPPSTLVASHQKIGLRPATLPIEQESKADNFHYQMRGAGLTSLMPLEPEIQRAFNQAREQVGEIERLSGPRASEPGDDVIVTTLGTGSAMPSKYRNVSSTLIQIPNWGNVLLDCGEGTWGQLSRRFGKDPSDPDGNVYGVLNDIKCIFISHIHGDHHIGLSKVLAQRRRMKLSTPVYLITTRRTMLYLEEYNDLEDIGMRDPTSGVRCIATDLPTQLSEEGPTQSMSDLYTALGLEHISLPKVNHRTVCYGIVLKHKDGWSIAFSGDTTPVDSLVEAGEGATLLIHEATMADDQEEMALQKTHSTFGQAVDVAKRMRAKKLLLTHFSNRYPKIPRSHDVSSEQDRITIAVAFDYASYRLGDMWKMPHYLPALEASFVDGTEDDTFQHVD